MAHEPTPAEIRAFAERNGLTEDQAREILTRHGEDEGGLAAALENLKHFLKAPS